MLIYKALLAVLVGVVAFPAIADAAPRQGKQSARRLTLQPLTPPTRDSIAQNAEARWLLPDTSDFQHAVPREPTVRWTGNKVKMKTRVQLW